MVTKHKKTRPRPLKTLKNRYTEWEWIKKKELENSAKPFYKRQIFFEFIIILLLSVVIFVQGMQTYKNFQDPIEEVLFKDLNEPMVINSSIAEGCENLTFFETAHCLNNNVKSIFYYNLSNVGVVMNFTQLKKEGGVCHHYSELYYGACKYFNYSCQEIEIPGHIYTSMSYLNKTTVSVFNETNNETINITTRKGGYCDLDQTLIYCVEYN